MGRCFVLSAFVAVAIGFAHGAERHANGIIARILDNAAKIRAAAPDAVPMAFWDFDGTIIKGDISEGLEEGGEKRFKGLVERTIEAGLCPVYPKEDGWRRYSQGDYPRMREIGRWLAWPYNAQIYAGVAEDELHAFCEKECDKVYREWYFASSLRMMRALEEAGVENYIVSASPELFVRAAAKTLGLPQWRFRGIRVEIVGGRVTTRVVHPVPYAEGKVENVRDIVLARKGGVAVAAFGNSYSTDGAFLRYVATQPSLPGGAKGTAVMINGGKVVPGYTEHFITVDQDEVAGPPGAMDVEYVAHQGEEALAPNHSKAAYRLAVEHGLDYMKLDVRETKDGHVVLQHDATLRQTMGWDARIDSLTLAEIRERGRCRTSTVYTNETIVTLPEALEIARGMKKGVWIDFKHFKPAFAEKVFSLLDAAGYPDDRIMVATFTKPALEWVQANRPNVRRVAHTSIKLVPGGFVANDGSGGRVHGTELELADALDAHGKALGLHGFNMPAPTFRGAKGYDTSPFLIAELKRRGYWISIWFVYNSRAGQHFRMAGADAFVTNCKANTFPDAAR